MNQCRLLTLAIVLSGAAEGQNFILDITDGSNVPVPADGMIPVSVIYTGDDVALKGFKMVASRFTSTDQDSAPVKILRHCDSKARPEDPPVAFVLQDDRTVSLCLQVPALGSDGKYSGSLTLLADNKKPEVAKKFTVSRAVSPPATLTTDRPSVIVEVERPILGWFRAFDTQLSSVVLEEKSAKGNARDVVVQVEPTFKAPGAFDALTGLAFEWNNNTWDTPFSSPSAGAGRTPTSRVINAGQQATVAVAGKNLQPGEYVVPLHFVAANANTDGAKFALTFRVRDSIWGAIGALVIALILSFVITKVLTGKRRRINLLQQIQSLRLSKGTTLPPLPAVVWVDALLHLSERLSSRFWLSGADIIDGHVNSVRGTVDILKQVREVRASLQQHVSQLVFDRAAESIDHIVSEIGTEPPDDALAARIKTEIGGFNNWLQAATFPAAVWSAIQPNLARLQREINTGVASDSVREAIKQLKADLDTKLGTSPQTVEAVEESYRNYARLRILWDCRLEDAVFAKLTAKPEPDLAECFRLNDGLAWEYLKARQARLKIEEPSSTGSDGLESFTPLTFSVRSDDATVSGSYLFRHKVKYSWKFTLEPAAGTWREKLRWKKPKSVILTPTTLGPSVVQYFPRGGRVKVSVSMSYTGEPIPIAETPGSDIRDSSEFGILRAFEGVEYVSWFIAAVVALATGLSTYYFKNPTFGSYQDYLTLGLWGVGMDQGKNFLQALQSVSSQPSGPQTH